MNFRATWRMKGVLIAFPPPPKTRALNEVETFLKLGYEFRYVFDAVLVISVNGNEPVVTALQSPPKSHAQLSSLLAGACFDKKRVDTVLTQKVFFRRSVCGPPITNDYVPKRWNLCVRGSFQFVMDAFSFIDNRDENAVLALFGLIALNRKSGDSRYGRMN